MSLGDTITTSPQWTSTVTGRIGAAFDRSLVYGKGGVAFAEDKSTFTPVGGATATDTTDTGRLDGRRRPRICAHRQLVGARRIRLSRLRLETAQLYGAAAGAVTTNANLNVQEVKAGFDYKFGP